LQSLCDGFNSHPVHYEKRFELWTALIRVQTTKDPFDGIEWRTGNVPVDRVILTSDVPAVAEERAALAGTSC